METDRIERDEGGKEEEQRHMITVSVNEQPVEFQSHTATGAEIKRAAFSQNVHIQPDFVLREDLANGTDRVIEAHEEVHLHKDMRFTAVAPTVAIFINEQRVDLHVHRATGAEIKAAAIAQNVHIRPDSVLREDLTDGTDRIVGDHEEVHLHHDMRFTAVAPTVTISVNEQPVEIHANRTTGTEIKAAAIAQGVLIQQNFVLQEELANGTSRIIGDNDEVHLRKHLRFTAIAPDDNS